MTLVLAIESSCDETAAAVVDDGRVKSSVVSSQVDVHAAFGGVVPELASRHHLGAVVSVIRAALNKADCSDWANFDAIAVTEGPGLMGALLVGVQTARGLAISTGLPLMGIHHMEGHLFSAFLGDHEREPRPFVPHIALLVSGGHTEIVDVAGLGDYRILGSTRDDAAGEAYDKVAKVLGLGYPGGPIVDRLATEGNATAYSFPRGMADRDHLDFSFSGLKTAVMVHLERQGAPKSRAELADVCASFQAAVVDVLLLKALKAVRASKYARLHVVGGVAANRGLRAAVEAAAKKHGFAVEIPPLRYCGDNAAMIGGAACARIKAGGAFSVNVHTSTPIDDRRFEIS